MSAIRRFVLIACSASKVIPPDESLIWGAETSLECWSESWTKANKLIAASDLYTGRSVVNQIRVVEDSEIDGWGIISAGAGLILKEDMLPSYESTFAKGRGPDSSQWPSLPLGGLERIPDCEEIITFAPPNYQKALAQDRAFSAVKDRLTVASNSILKANAANVLQLHARASEVIGCAKSDLASNLVDLYFSEGRQGFSRINDLATALPEPRTRRKVSDGELIGIVSELTHLGPLGAIVRHIRDNTDVAASYERIREARNLVLSGEN